MSGMFWNIFLLFIGLFVLIMGGDSLVKGASRIALRLHISPLVVGLTIVAFGTSAPELLISLKSALSGSPDLAMGNVVGSNICNLALVLGVTATISNIHVGADSMKIDWPMAMGSSLLMYFLVGDGDLTFYEGVLFVSLLIGYTVFIIRRSRSQSQEARTIEQELEKPTEDSPSTNIWKDLGFIALGCAGLYFGAEWFVGGAQELARFLGVSERIIGITVVALGTSLPELVTAIVASFKKETDLALGNLMGSNIFNVLSILGITSIVKDIEVNQAIRNVDMLWMLGITFLILPLMLTSKKIERIEGVLLLLIYSVYIYLVVS